MTRQYVHEEDLTIPQGTDFTESMTISQRDGDPLSLSGISSCAGRMRTSYAYYTTTGTDFTVEIDNITGGVVDISFTSSATEDLRPGFYVYDIVGFTTSGALWRLAEGKINLTPRVY